MAAVLAALMITQGSFTAFADEIGPGYDEQNKGIHGYQCNGSCKCMEKR